MKPLKTPQDHTWTVTMDSINSHCWKMNLIKESVNVSFQLERCGAQQSEVKKSCRATDEDSSGDDVLIIWFNQLLGTKSKKNRSVRTGMFLTTITDTYTQKYRENFTTTTTTTTRA